jgi:hypothetical protein
MFCCITTHLITSSMSLMHCYSLRRSTCSSCCAAQTCPQHSKEGLNGLIVFCSYALTPDSKDTKINPTALTLSPYMNQMAGSICSAYKQQQLHLM